MKKLIAKLLVMTVLLTALPLTLTSCSGSLLMHVLSGSARATYFYSQINQNANSTSSNSMEQTTSLLMDLSGDTYQQVTEGTITFIGGEDDFTYLEQFKTTVTSGWDTTVIYEDSGYADGMMFLYSREGRMDSKLKSPITPEEYSAFMMEKNGDSPEIRVGKGYSETMTCVQNEDKTWTATYEDFTEVGMEPFYYMMKGIEYAVTSEHKLVDVRMTCTADEKLYPTELYIEYLFEETEGAEGRVPEVFMKTTYTGWNNTVLAEPYDISDFTEVEDARQVERFLKALQDRETAEAGAFEVVTSATSYYGSQKESTQTSQEVSFQNSGDGYRFTMDYSQAGYDYHVSYRDGSATTSVYEQDTNKLINSNTRSLQDYEAQATVQQLMDSESISRVDIVGAELRDEEEEIYRFALGDNVRNKLNEQYEEAYGTTMETFRGYISVNMKDGELEQYTYFVEATMKINGSTLSMTMSMIVTFTDPVENSESI